MGEQTLPYAISTPEDDLLEDASEELENITDELQLWHVCFDLRRLTGPGLRTLLHKEAERSDAGLVVVGVARQAKIDRSRLGSTAERLGPRRPVRSRGHPQGLGSAGAQADRGGLCRQRRGSTGAARLARACPRHGARSCA